MGNLQKRRDVFRYLKQKGHSIYCLQDTHFDKKTEKYVTSEWGYILFYFLHKSNSRDVAVLFNNNFEFKVREVQRDENGNFMIILLFAMNKELLLVNIYGPNKDNPAFYQSLSETIKRYKNHNVVIVGDWNLVLDSQLDCYNYKHINNPKAKEVVENVMSLS